MRRHHRGAHKMAAGLTAAMRGPRCCLTSSVETVGEGRGKPPNRMETEEEKERAGAPRRKVSER